ncbi:histone-lysine N-methyltransferase, H3 lysine-79 specific isoform X2 [Fopius arisanus]|nr:PREDICTED: histone-lysine N-methyltransferase, H3 lysine-79 specific isoform X2 [Fopius arisanus]
MVFTAFTYVALAGAVWVFLRLLQACFSLPKHLKKQNDIQQMLQDKVDSYEKYIEECEAKEKEAAESGETVVSVDENGEERSEVPVIDETKWKERRECLEMLKKELRRVRDGGDQYDWDYLLEEDEKEEKEEKDILGKEEKKEKGEAEENHKKMDDETFSDVDEEKCKSKTQLNFRNDVGDKKEPEEIPVEEKKKNK